MIRIHFNMVGDFEVGAYNKGRYPTILVPWRKKNIKNRLKRIIRVYHGRRFRQELEENHIQPIKVNKMITMIKNEGAIGKVHIAMAIVQLEKTTENRKIYQLRPTGLCKIKIQVRDQTERRRTTSSKLPEMWKVCEE